MSTIPLSQVVGVILIALIRVILISLLGLVLIALLGQVLLSGRELRFDGTFKFTKAATSGFSGA